jgi:two-component system response regulator
VSSASELAPAPRVNFLVVQADPAELEETVNALAELCSRSSIATAGDGGQALDYLLGRGPHAGRDLRKQPRLVLIDPQSPSVDALDVLQVLRADPWTRAVPVAVWTQAPRRTLDGYYAHGANSVVQKTQEPAALRRKMREVHDFWIYVNEADRQSRL